MSWQAVNPPGSPPPMAPYVPAVRADRTVYVSGMLALDGNGATVGVGDIRAQTRQVIENIREVLSAAGAGLEDVVSNQIFLRRADDYAGMNEVYREFFGGRPPARYCVICELVKPDCLVEIVSTACITED